MFRRSTAGFFLAFLVGAVPALAGKEVAFRALRPNVATPPTGKALTDEEALKAASLKADNPDDLLAYFKQRTVSDIDLSKIRAAIARFGSEDFDDRLKAAVDVEKFGPAAVGPLRAAEKDNNLEIAYRAGECLKRIEKVPHSVVALAAVRALAKLKPEGTASVLLAFLPFADTDAVGEEIGRTLIAVAADKNGRPDPALVAALTDTLVSRRVASTLALIEGGPATERIRIKDSYPKVLAAAKAETDPEAKFRMMYALATVAREKDSIGSLIALIPDLPRGRLWQVEDFLLQLAGKDAPKVVLGRTSESLNSARDSWKGWWEKSNVDLNKFAYTPRVAGITQILLWDQQFGNNGAVLELGPDMKERWRIDGLQYPTDAIKLPDGKVIVAEQNTNQVTVRDLTGKVLGNKSLWGKPGRVNGNQPGTLQLLDNGNLLVGCRNAVFEFKKDADEVVNSLQRNEHDICAVGKLPNGEIMMLLQNNGQPNYTGCKFLDAKFKPIEGRKTAVAHPFYQAELAVTGPNTVLITEQNRVAEYDMKKGEKGEVIWSKAVNSPRSVQRLPNGNTLFVDGSRNRLVEVTPNGEEVWSYSGPQGFQLFRGSRK
jgi:outer membrane protein assembly factor BamB